MSLFSKKIFFKHSHHFLFIIIFIVGVYLIWLDSRSTINHTRDANSGKTIITIGYSGKNDGQNVIIDEEDQEIDERARGEREETKDLDEKTKEGNSEFITKKDDQPGKILTEEGKLIKGDSIETIMRGKVPKAVIEKCLNAGNKVFRMQSFRIGHRYFFSYTKNGELELFEYEIDPTRHLVIEGPEPKAAIKNSSVLTTLEVLSFPIDRNLYNAVADIGEKPQIAEKVMQIFGSVVDFSKNLHEGDSISLLIERRFRDERYVGYGRILACMFHVKHKTFQAYLFNDSGERPQYYSESGLNLRKTFFKAPLSIIRVSSRFSHSRLHPIFGEARPHLGVDYSAPSGTPVRSVADGVVEKCGWASGFGKQVIVKHSGGIESWYSHLSAFSIGLKEGVAIEQGKVIGYVGSTGVSTGPHLDFRFKKGDDFINPDQIINHSNRQQEVKDLKNFKRVMQIEREYLEGKRPLTNYTADTIIAFNDAEIVSTDVKRDNKDIIKSNDQDKTRKKKSSKSKRSKRRRKN